MITKFNAKFKDKRKRFEWKFRLNKREVDVDAHIRRSDRKTVVKEQPQDEGLGHEEGPDNEMRYEEVEEEIVGAWNPSLSWKQAGSPISGYGSNDDNMQVDGSNIHCFETLDMENGNICFSESMIEINEDSADEIDSEELY